MNRYFATIAAIFGLDLGTKYMVKKYIPLGSRKNLIENRFSFHWKRNTSWHLRIRTDRCCCGYAGDGIAR